MRHPLCMISRHTGQERGGLALYTCTRCGGEFRQPHFDKLPAAFDAAVERLRRDEDARHDAKSMNET